MKRGSSGINALIAIDKPLNKSSHGAVAAVRSIIQEKRVGHGGTLDPLATGVLVVGIGQATRLMQLLSSDIKSYEALIRFGEQTSTDDAEGQVIASSVVPQRLKDFSYLVEQVGRLVGRQMQVPPDFSAISVGGVRAYQSAREGKQVELPARQIQVFEARLVDIVNEDPLICQVSFTVSKGTYIRSLARDFGLMMGTHAHLVGLRRTVAGTITLDDCVDLDELALEYAEDPEYLDRIAIDPFRATQVSAYKLLSEDELRWARQGRRLAATGLSAPCSQGQQVALIRDHKLYGLWKVQDGQLVADVNFLDGIRGVGLE